MCAYTVKRVVAVVGVQPVGLPVQREPGAGDPVGHAPDQAPEVGGAVLRGRATRCRQEERGGETRCEFVW
jgi:hypothetical protein